MPDFDVLIVGGGPIGAATALALQGSGLAVGLLEARPREAARDDPRPIALAHGSRLILERLGVWDSLQPATPIERIHVSQRGGFGRLALDAREAGLPALGYVVDYSRLADALARALEAFKGCRVTRGLVTALSGGGEATSAHYSAENATRDATARLVVLAEGGALAATGSRNRDYGQSVVTTRVRSSIAHRNTAYERFTPSGPVALLPMEEMLAVVWTTTPTHAQELCAASDATFIEGLQLAFGRRLGVFSHPTARSAFPLSLKVAGRIAEPRVVALGNAAQTLHPVAGQGLNLGLRDAWELAASVRERAGGAIGSAEHLGAYRARRRLDRAGSIGFTDTLVRLFSNDISPLKLARGVGLAALGVVPPARDFVIRRMTFGTRG